MTIESLPPPLQPIIQDNYLDHMFEDSLCSKLGFRVIADRESFAIGSGETITKTRAGLLVPTVTPLDPATDLALDNGLTAEGWTIEQYTLALNTYGATMDLNQETSLVAIDTLFLCPPDLAPYNVVPRTHHRRKFANILFSDGHVSSRSNRDGRFEVDLRDYAQVRNAFDKILQVLERADAEP